MTIKLTHFLSLFLLVCTSCKSQVNTEVLLDSDALLKHIKILSSDDFEGRRTGTPGAIKAKSYIIEQFKKLDVSPLDETFEQPFSFNAENKSYKGDNVLGFIKGSEFPEKHIVISAHYDHEGIKKGKIYNGADDDASGVSALFSFAEYFKTHPPKHSVILAAFDAEELGLKGSKYFVDNSIIPLDNIVLNVNMDMISRSNKNELYVVGTRYTPSLKPIISNFKTSDKISLKIGHDGSDKTDNWTNSSDHTPFYKKEIPFLYFGVEDHKDYHKPTDDFENIHPEFYIEAVNTIIKVFQELDNLKFNNE